MLYTAWFCGDVLNGTGTVRSMSHSTLTKLPRSILYRRKLAVFIAAICARNVAFSAVKTFLRVGMTYGPVRCGYDYYWRQ